MKIRVSVKPRSLLSKVISFEGNMLHVNVAAIPHKGKSNLELIKTDGVSFNILKSEWLISSDESVNYISQFKKI